VELATTRWKEQCFLGSNAILACVMWPSTPAERRRLAMAAPHIWPSTAVTESKAVRDTIRAAGAKRTFLPAYSPDLNPIEQVFAKLKHLMRKAGERTIDATWNRLGTSLDHFSPQECANYFRNAGYAS
jgi:transposase